MDIRVTCTFDNDAHSLLPQWMPTIPLHPASVCLGVFGLSCYTFAYPSTEEAVVKSKYEIRNSGTLPYDGE